MQVFNKFFLLIIRFYQKAISPFLPQRCRFYPSCSEYGIQVFKCLPFYKAVWYLSLRILRCHPLSAGGFDPAPCPCGDKDSEHRTK